MFKKAAMWAAVAVFAASLLAGCGSGAATSGTQGQQDGKTRVICTVYPAYDWIMQLVAGQEDAFDVTYLLDDGVDMHNYQPTVQDIADISSCDLFVYGGGESDSWVADALQEAANADMKTVNMLEVIGDAAVEEEAVEGMQAEGSAGAAAEEESELDEHTWLSLRNAQAIVTALANTLGEFGEDQANACARNAELYNEQLAQLDAQYRDAVENAPHDTLVFADRFAFRYLVEDYQLKYYAAFSGCSAETEASFETVAFLARKVDELGVSGVIALDGSDGKVAQTVVSSTTNKDQEVYVMDSLQSTTLAEAQGGKTYLSTMQSNLDVLRSALS